MTKTAPGETVDNPSWGQLKGSARGALICVLFGSAWMFLAVVFSGHATPIRFGAVAVTATILTFWSVARIRATQRFVYSESDLHHWKSFRKLFWIDSAIEWLSAAVAANILAYYRRLDLIPQVLGVIIGLHFLPLAKIFRQPLYYATGAAIIIVALGTLLTPPGGMRNLAGCATIGITLWLTALINLRRTWRHAQTQS